MWISMFRHSPSAFFPNPRETDQTVAKLESGIFLDMKLLFEQVETRFLSKLDVLASAKSAHFFDIRLLEKPFFVVEIKIEMNLWFPIPTWVLGMIFLNMTTAASANCAC